MQKKEKEEQNRLDVQLLLDYISEIKYGSVTVSIQDGKIVQIEKSEKVRFK